MSMIQYRQTTTRMRKWQMLALLVLAFLTIVAISYLTLYTVGHIDPLHLFMSLAHTPDIMNGHP